MNTFVGKLGKATAVRAALLSLVALFGLSACASQRMESPGSAWELVNDNEVVGARAEQNTPASDKVVHTRKPMTLTPQSPVYAEDAQGKSLAARGMDERSPTGWTRQSLVANWGMPTLISGESWQYRSRDGQRCVSLSLEGGVVTAAKPGCP